jgi:CheY-like chemotaxis protein
VEAANTQIFLGNRNLVNSSEVYRSEEKAEARPEARPKILVVDDERLLADTTAAILRHAGFETRIAYDGFAALEVAGSFRPDYILADIMMPAMSGVELAIAISKMYPATKIMLFSGQAGISEILEQSKARGFEFPLLAKPVHPAKLIEGFRKLKDG